MPFESKHRFVRISPRKARLVMDLVRGRDVDDAINLLRFSKQRASVFIEKVIRSAVANASEQSVAPARNAYYVATARVDAGPVIKRFQPKDRGKAYPINKRTSHLVVSVDERGDDNRSKSSRVQKKKRGNRPQHLVSTLTDPVVGDTKQFTNSHFSRILSVGEGSSDEKLGGHGSGAEWSRAVSGKVKKSDVHEQVKMPMPLPDWSITWRDHNGPTWSFRAASNGKQVEERPSASLIAGEHDVRFQVFSPRRKACLFLDSFRGDDKGHFLSVIWAHSVAFPDLWHTGTELLRAFQRANGSGGDAEVYWVLNGFPRPQARRNTIDAILHREVPKPPEEPLGLFFKLNAFEYEVQVSRWDEEEPQIGVVWPAAKQDQLPELLAPAICNTAGADLRELSKRNVTQLLANGVAQIFPSQ